MSEPVRRVALVTGGSRGIGRAIVRELAALGYDLAVNYRRDEQAAESVCEQSRALGALHALALKADISDLEQCRMLVQCTMDEFGRVDLLVNNAGVAPEVRLDILDTTPESWDRVLRTNLRGPYFLTQAVARSMIDLGERAPGDDPQVHFITSVSSAYASTNRGEYCVSKAALSMVAQLFAVRLAEFGIRVFEIRPGIIETDMTAPVRACYEKRFAEGLAPIARWGTPSDVGRVVAALATGHLPYATGNVIYVDGGMHLRRL